MKTSILGCALALVAASAIVACGDDTSGATGSGGGGAGGAGDGGSATATSATSGSTTIATSTSGATTTSATTTSGSTTATSGSTTATTAVTTTGSGEGGTTGDGGAGGGGQVELPDVSATVQQVASEHADLLEINTYESCGLLVQYVLAALSASDPEWGHVAKTAGEGQYTPADWVPVDIDGYTITGFSQDAIFHRAAYRQVDIIGNAAANSDPDKSIHGPANITWNVIEPEFYRENNPWMAPVPPP